MAPRKAAEKSPIILDAKPKRGVRKKTPTAKSLVARKLETLPTVDITVPSDDNDEPQNAPLKVKKPKLTKNVNLNGIKSLKDHQTSNEVIEPEFITKIIKKPRATRIKNPIRNKIEIRVVNEANMDKPQEIPVKVPAKIKKTKTAKQNHNEIKIMLANEVIRNAFQKKPPMVMIPRKPLRPGRKKTACKTNNNVENLNIEANKLLNKHGDIQDVAKKKTEKKTSNITLEDSSQKSPITDSITTDAVPKKRRKLSLKRKTSSVIPTSQNIPDKEGKEETQESKAVGNNATSLPNQSVAPDSTSKTDCRKKNTSNLSSRKNSDTSTSTCFSWTKDISSSSAITCVTVESNDFVRIDKKIPILKLTNIDHKSHKKIHVDNIFEENSFDSRQEQSKCNSESSISIGNLNVSQTLNLSTSSMTSVPSKTLQNHANKENKDEKIIKLQQSLENLSSKMKNFDLEIISWIGYGNDSDNTKIKNFHARIFEVLNEENEVIRYCKEIKRVLVGDQQPAKVIAECPVEIEGARSKQVIDKITVCNPPNNTMDNSVKQNKDVSETDSLMRKEKDTEADPNCGEILNDTKLFDKNIEVQDNDDDDALSLFAESITGLESSRKNSSFGLSISNDKSVIQPDFNDSRGNNKRVIQHISNQDDEDPTTYKIVNNVKKQTADSSTVTNKASEIIPEFQTDNCGPIANVDDSFVNRCNVDDFGVNYDRFNISDNTANHQINKTLFSNSIDHRNDQVRSPIDTCESSSIRTEYQNYKGREFPHNNFDVTQGIVGNTSENWNTRGTAEFVDESENSNLDNPNIEQFDQSNRIANQFLMANKQIPFVPTLIFKNVCIFHLISKCKNIVCVFPHKHIDPEFVKSKLQEMSEEMFIKELLYFLKWPILNRKYGGCFVEECVRRNLTIWLLHIVKVILTKIQRNKRINEAFATEIVENTLLHLNEADIEACANILRSNIKANVCLCDHFMKAISETQNFSRFKHVFIKLTSFMCKIGRSFRLAVATQLLERLCILPYDDALARTLMKIIAKTNPSIFKVSMMKILENQLSKNNPLLYKELMSLKVQAERYSQNVPSPPMQSPLVASSSAALQTSTPVARADSPDTTNVDFVNKTTEPVITRTITIPRMINVQNSIESESSEESPMRYEQRKPQPTWRNYPPSLMSLRPHRQVYKRLQFAPRAFNGALPKFRRRPPQEPY